ncbi:Protein kinase of the Mitotic Exit Network [Coemansia sp. RSA 2320]|nr:Protein kinase of the Mitotic Exit Network [Coemansia sp. RSA 2320]
MTTKSAHATLFGDFQPEELLGQLKAEQQSRNYDTAIRFVDAVLGLQLDASTLHDSLRDGMENISNFLAAARTLGLQSTDLFQTVDLYEGKNMPRVIMTLLTIARVVAGIPLNSHRKLADTSRSLGEGWNTGTLTDGVTLSPNAAQAGHATLRNQPALVRATGTAHSTAAATTGATKTAATTALALALATSEATGSRAAPLSPYSPLSQHRAKAAVPSLRQERRRSKRRSATTLFLASNVSKNCGIATRKPAVLDVALEVLHTDAVETAPANDAPTSADTSGDDGRVPDFGFTEEGDNAFQNMQEQNLEEFGDAAKDNTESAVPRPRKRIGTKSKPKERLTVYSESAQRLTNYQLGNCIGRGQFGSVYRALDLETGQMVAVKQILLEGQDIDNMEDIMQEVELLKSLSSPRIVRYHGFVKTDTHLNLVMEYVENGSLSATLKSFGSFPEKLVLAYAVKIIEGLIYLHGRDVVHCDLKACNILTTKQGNTKLTDFGVSLNLKLRKPGDESVVAGTPYWMAPEIIQLDGACMASDIWSLGCTVIELLTGKPPYSGLMQMAALYRIVEDDHPPIPEGISEELKDFLLLCFQKNPQDRPTAPELMSHGWTMQYRRNRKEMKLLRRTCSRKMSSYMARGKAGGDYPTFNPGMIKPLAEIPETGRSRSASESDGQDQDAPSRMQTQTQCPEPTSSSAQMQHQEQVRVISSGATAPLARAAAQDPEPNSPLIQAHFSDCDSVAERLGPVFAEAGSDGLSAGSGEDTDASLSTFEGPRMKRHRLRTILSDSVSVCALCAKSLSGAFIQCSSCKIRCHDACTRLLLPCTAMRMTRFLFPASRKSSKRYESKTPNIRLRASRKGINHGPDIAPPASSALVDMICMTSRSRVASVPTSPDRSLRMSSLQGTRRESRPSVLHGDALAGRPASIAVVGGALSRVGLALRGGGAALDLADSGWETDDATDSGPVSGPSPIDLRTHMLPLRASGEARQLWQASGSCAVASIAIPPPRQRSGPFSAPLAAASVPDALLSVAGTAQQQPKYYQPLATSATAPMHSTSRPRSIRRMRANTASLECLAGPPQHGALSTLLRRRQHPLRGATSSDFKAVAGFSPGAAQRAKQVHHGSNASISDLQSCSASELIQSSSDLGMMGGVGAQCFAVSGKSQGKRSQLKRSAKDCVIM